MFEFFFLQSLLLLGVLPILNFFEGQVPVGALIIFKNFLLGIVRHTQHGLAGIFSINFANSSLLDTLPRLRLLDFWRNALIFGGIFCNHSFNSFAQLWILKHIDDATDERNSVTVVQDSGAFFRIYVLTVDLGSTCGFYITDS